MKRLTLTKTATGNYTIVDYNDEKLRIIADALRKETLRFKIKDLLNNIESLQDQYHILSHENGLKYYLLKENNDFILIGLKDDNKPEDEANPLQIDMNVESFLDLIDSWEDLEIMEPQQIFLKRVEDVYIITNNAADL